jgi:hypothetical protein
MKLHLSAWNLVYLALMALGIAAAIYHVTGGRYANAVMAAGAAVLGTVIMLTDQTMPAVRERHTSRLATWRPWQDSDDSPSRPRDRWLSGSILSGFAATIVMSVLLVAAYFVVGFIGHQNGDQVSQWFWGLKHNDLTNGIYDVPIAAFSVNLLAGLAWALVYGRFVEPMLHGSGWWRGMVFSIAPWLLSLLVFFPLVGGGFLGMSLDAGPLPAIGNLLLHLVYGAILGSVYALPDVTYGEGRVDDATAKWENDSTAMGLVIGLTAGIVVGALATTVLSNDLGSDMNVILAGGAFGTFVGGLVGPMVGMNRHVHHELG